MAAATVPREKEVAAGILCIGAIGYAFVCLPAIGARGYPPIDPYWIGVTYLWLAPICLSALFDSYIFRSRRNWLIGYALVTAFFDSGTFIMIVPHRADPLGMLLLTIIPFGPMHLLIAFAVEALLQFLLRPARKIVETTQEKRLWPRFSLLTCLLGMSIVSLALGFPFTYRRLCLVQEHHRATEQADKDWSYNAAIVFVPHESLSVTNGRLTIQYEIDPITGLRSHLKGPDFGYCDSYNARIAELIERNGLPPASLKKLLPGTDQLNDWLNATDWEEITTFPYDLTPTIALTRGGGFHFWGITSTNSGNNLMIHTQPGTSIGLGSGGQRVYIHRQSPLVIVRLGADSLILLHEDGRSILTASKY